MREQTTKKNVQIGGENVNLDQQHHKNFDFIKDNDLSLLRIGEQAPRKYLESKQVTCSTQLGHEL